MKKFLYTLRVVFLAFIASAYASDKKLTILPIAEFLKDAENYPMLVGFTTRWGEKKELKDIPTLLINHAPIFKNSSYNKTKDLIKPHQEEKKKNYSLDLVGIKTILSENEIPKPFFGIPKNNGVLLNVIVDAKNTYRDKLPEKGPTFFEKIIQLFIPYEYSVDYKYNNVPVGENSGLFSTLNTVLPDTQQTLINHLIQTNPSKKPINSNINLLLDYKADPNVQNKDGNTLAHLYLSDQKAPSHGCWRLIDVSNVAKFTHKGETYLKPRSISSGQAKAGIEFNSLKKEYVIFNGLRILLENNTNLSVLNNNGQTPLHMKHAFDTIEAERIYSLLKEYNQLSALNIQDKDGVTPFMILAPKLTFDTLLKVLNDYLYDSKKNSIYDKDNATILHYIARHKILSASEIETLYNTHKNLFCKKNNHNRSALEIACHRLSPSACSSLEEKLGLRKDSLKNIPDEHGNTFLHCCFNNPYGRMDISRIVQCCGEQLFLKNHIGKNPLHYLMKAYDFHAKHYNDSHGWQENDHRGMAEFVNNRLTKEMLDSQDVEGNTVFHTFLKRSDLMKFCNAEGIAVALRWISKFLAKNPDLSIQNHKGNTPLHTLMRQCCSILYLSWGVDDTLFIKGSPCSGIDSITIRNVSDIFTIKNNREETPLRYIFNKKHPLSQQNIAKRWVKKRGEWGSKTEETLPDLLDPIKTAISEGCAWQDDYVRELFDKDFCSKDEFCDSIQERIELLKNNTVTIDPAVRIAVLRDIKQYVDRKYNKYANTKVYFMWLLKHMKTTLTKQYSSNKYFLSKDVREYMSSFGMNDLVSCPFSLQLDTIITKLENNDDIDDYELLNGLTNAAQQFMKIKERYKKAK